MCVCVYVCVCMVCVYTSHILFIHSSIGGPLGCFYILYLEWESSPVCSFVSSHPVFPTLFIEEDVFPSSIYSCFLCHRLIDHMSVGLHWALSSASLIYVSVFVPVPYYLDNCSFEV